MARFDAESFRDHFLNLLKNNISSKISEINTEKGDSLLLVPSADQYISDMNSKVMQYDWFILHQIGEITAIQTGGPLIAKEIELFFTVWFTDREGGDDAENKTLRYMRVLEEIFTDNFDKSPYISDIEIETFAPFSIAANNSSQIYRAAGVGIKGVIA